jgi:hypothetical protein
MEGLLAACNWTPALHESVAMLGCTSPLLHPRDLRPRVHPAQDITDIILQFLWRTMPGSHSQLPAYNQFGASPAGLQLHQVRW